MQENKTDNLELFYDCVDESNNVLYEATHKNYFELIKIKQIRICRILQRQF